MTPRLSLLLAICLLALGLETAFAFEVALIGDKSKRSAFQQISTELNASTSQSGGIVRARTADGVTVFSVTESSENPIAVANQLLTADLALLVVDSTQGPLPIVREQLIIARQTRIPAIAVYFFNTRALQVSAPKDARELLELEEVEMRELMNKYEMGGERAPVLFDGDVGKVSKLPYAKGTPDLRRYLASVQLRRPPQPALRSVTEFGCYYYLLSSPEANGHGVTLADRSKVDVWIEGNSTVGTVKSSSLHKPGDNGKFVLRLSLQLKAVEGARVLLVKDGVTVGLGVVTDVLR